MNNTEFGVLEAPCHASQVIYMKYAILKSSLAHDKKKATL